MFWQIFSFPNSLEAITKMDELVAESVISSTDHSKTVGKVVVKQIQQTPITILLALDTVQSTRLLLIETILIKKDFYALRNNKKPHDVLIKLDWVGYSDAALHCERHRQP